MSSIATSWDTAVRRPASGERVPAAIAGRIPASASGSWRCAATSAWNRSRCYRGWMRPRNASDWLGSAEAAARLGVKAETLYAYVSRGLLRSERVRGSRTARYLRGDVERLAARARRTGPSGPELVVDSEITLLDP